MPSQQNSKSDQAMIVFNNQLLNFEWTLKFNKVLLSLSVLLTLLIRSSFQAFPFKCPNHRPNWLHSWSLKRFCPPQYVYEVSTSLYGNALSSNFEIDPLIKTAAAKKSDRSSYISPRNRVNRNQINNLIGEQIKDIFSNSSNSHREVSNRLQAFLSDHKNDLNQIHAVSLLHRSARARFAIHTAIPLQFLASILSRPSARPTRAGEVAQIIYGLRLMSIDDDPPTPISSSSEGGVKIILKVANAKLLECQDDFSGKDIATSLYGLQKFTGSEPEVVDLLRNLAKKLKSSNATLNSQEISNSLYGLRKMSSDNAEVSSILNILAKKIDLSDSVLNAQAISNALNGLQGMSSNSSECIAVVRGLTRKIRESPDAPFSSLSVGCALMGLRSMSAERVEIQELLEALLEKIEPCQDDFNEVSLTSALNGLRSMSDSQHPTVRRLLSKLAQLMEASSVSDFGPHVLSHLLAGLKSMTGQSKELRSVVAVIAFKMLLDRGHQHQHEQQLQFSSHEIGLTLGGLQSIDSKSCPEVLIVLDKISKRLALSPSSSSSSSLSSRHAALALYGLKSLTPSAVHHAEVRAILAVLAERIINGCSDALNPQLLGMALLGLRGASSSVTEVVAVLAALTPKVSTAVPLDGQCVGNMLLSLQGMTADPPAVRSFLAAVAAAMNAVEEDATMAAKPSRGRRGSAMDMTAQEICNAIYGLQGMDSKYPEVISVVQALNQRFAHRQQKRQTMKELGLPEDKGFAFTAQGVGNALSGLQSMSFTDSDEISVMLGYLADEAEACTEIMKAQDLANAFFGLQGMSNACEEARAVLAALVVKMRESSEVFTARDIGYCLTGLNSMQQYLHQEVDEVIEELHYKVAATEYGGQMNVLFLQFGKAIRVKIGDAFSNLNNVADTNKKRMTTTTTTTRTIA